MHKVYLDVFVSNPHVRNKCNAEPVWTDNNPVPTGNGVERFGGVGVGV